MLVLRASRFEQILTEYSKAPNVTRERLYLDMMQQVLSNTSKIVVDQKNGNNLLYLPLDKLINMSGSTSASPAPTSTVVQETTPDSSLRAREYFQALLLQFSFWAVRQSILLMSVSRRFYFNLGK